MMVSIKDTKNSKYYKYYDDVLDIIKKSPSWIGWVRVNNELKQRYPNNPDFDNTRMKQFISAVKREVGLNPGIAKDNTPQPKENAIIETPDKNVGEFNYKEWVDVIKAKKDLKFKAGSTQQLAHIKVKVSHEIIVLPLSDLHLGALGTDYELFMELTGIILENPNVYVAFFGDLVDNFVRFKNIAAVHQQVLNPSEQQAFLRSWIEEIKHKILFASWGNHEEFTERWVGMNPIQSLLSDRLVYFDGIGLANLTVGEAEYKIGFTHKSRYYSSFNLTHGAKQLARRDLPGCDIYITGDKHEPAMEVAPLGMNHPVLIQLGTLKTVDPYSRRYFSYLTHAIFPCFVLDHESKDITPFYTIDKAMRWVTSQPV